MNFINTCDCIYSIKVWYSWYTINVSLLHTEKTQTFLTVNIINTNIPEQILLFSFKHICAQTYYFELYKACTSIFSFEKIILLISIKLSLLKSLLSYYVCNSKNNLIKQKIAI